MRISNSKKQLARIINENGGWRDGAKFAAQGRNHGHVGFASVAPVRNGKVWDMTRGFAGKFLADEILPNWHQTILSRDEYFHLYPAPDADGWIEWEGGMCPVEKYAWVETRRRDGEVVEPTPSGLLGWQHFGSCEDIVAYRIIDPERISIEPTPTIEQLAAYYRNRKDYADRKQQEADDAKADVGAKLKALKLAGKEHGLLVSPITAKQDPEPELVIKVQVGDEVECIKSNVNPGKYTGRIGTVSSVDVDDTSTPYLVDFGGEAKIWCHEVKFIRRP